MNKFILILLLPVAVFGQTVKTYNGTYEKGKATYQYYEKENGERVYQGKFHYECEDFGDNYPYQTIDGNYINGEKSGKWTYKYEAKSTKDFVSTIKKEMPYSNGKLNGEYSDEKSFVETKDGKLEKKVNSRTKINYKQGKPNGFFSFENIYPIQSLYKGSIDSLGFADGMWYIKDVLVSAITSDKPSVKFESNIEYVNGLLITNKTINIETGKILEDYKYTNNTTVTDTSFYKQAEAIYISVSCVGKNYNQCQTNAGDFKDLISKNIGVDFKTKSNVIRISTGGQLFYKQLADSINKLKKDYTTVLNGAVIKYTGAIQGIYIEPSNGISKTLQVDTSQTLIEYNNRIAESLYKLNLLFSIYKYAFDQGGNPANKIIKVSKSENTYSPIFSSPDKLAPGSFFIQAKQYFADEVAKTRADVNIFQTRMNLLVQKWRELDEIRKTNLKINEFNSVFEKKAYYIESQYTTAKIVRVPGKNYSISNDYLGKYYENSKRKLDSYGVDIKASQDVNLKLKLSIERDSFLINTEKLYLEIPKLTSLVESNKGKSNVANATLKYDSESLDLINSKFFKPVYSDYLPEAFTEISNSSNPKDVFNVIGEIKMVLAKVSQEADKANEEFAKKLKKCKNRSEIVTLIKSI